MKDCPFCSIPEDQIIFRNELAFVINDKYPDSKGHLLAIPFRHFSSYFDAAKEERIAILELLDKAKAYTDDKYLPPAYRIQVNIGRQAGQIIYHLHFHLVPHYN